MGDPGDETGVNSFGEAIDGSTTGVAVMGGGPDVGSVIIGDLGDPGDKMGCARIGGVTGVTAAGKSSFLPSVSVTFSTLPGIQEAFTCAAVVGAMAGWIGGSVLPSSETTDSSTTNNNPSGTSKSGGGPSS